MTPLDVFYAAIIGLVAGLVGGLCGIGGSIIMLPALGLVFGYHTPDGQVDPQATEHHLYMASAMLVNMVVAGTALRTHFKAGAIDRSIVVKLLPPMALAILFGVMVGDSMPGRIPRMVLVGFLFLYAFWSILSAARKWPEPTPDQQRITALRVGSIGTVTGFLAGFLAIGGGVIMVPAMQLIARIPLRKAIAASAAAMCVAAPIGAALKFAKLSEHHLSARHALMLGLSMALGASIGSPMGARLTHRLKLPHLRLAVAVVLAASGLKLAGIV